MHHDNGSEGIASISLPKHASDWPSDGVTPRRLADGFLVRMKDPSSYSNGRGHL